jgi:hypothetical protein
MFTEARKRAPAAGRQAATPRTRLGDVARHSAGPLRYLSGRRRVRQQRCALGGTAGHVDGRAAHDDCLPPSRSSTGGGSGGGGSLPTPTATAPGHSCFADGANTAIHFGPSPGFSHTADSVPTLPPKAGAAAAVVAGAGVAERSSQSATATCAATSALLSTSSTLAASDSPPVSSVRRAHTHTLECPEPSSMVADGVGTAAAAVHCQSTLIPGGN